MKKTDFNTRVTEIQNKAPSISGLATNSALTAIENKIPDVRSLVKKTNFNAKLTSLNTKITTNKSKHLLVENELKKLNTFDSSYFKGKNHFEEDGTQNYLVFQPMYRYFKKIGSTESIAKWESKGLSNEVIKSPDNTLTPEVEFTGKKMYVIFRGSCLKQDNVTFNYGKIVNIYIVYDLESILNTFDPTLENCLFGAFKLTKNSDINKYMYSDCGFGFGSKGTFSYPDDNSFGQNVLIFGTDMSSRVHANNILVLGKYFTQGINGTTIYAEKMYLPNFTVTRKHNYVSVCIIM